MQSAADIFAAAALPKPDVPPNVARLWAGMMLAFSIGFLFRRHYLVLVRVRQVTVLDIELFINFDLGALRFYLPLEGLFVHYHLLDLFFVHRFGLSKVR